MKRSIGRIWKHPVNWLLAGVISGSVFVGTPVYAITTTETILGSIPISRTKFMSLNESVLTTQGDVLVTYRHGSHWRVFSYDAQTGQVDRLVLAQEKKLRFDFITLEDTADGHAFLGYKYRSDPVLHYNVWNGSSWDYATTQYQTFTCGDLADFTIAATTDSVVMNYSAFNCAGDFYQSFREYDLLTQQWTEFPLDNVDNDVVLEVIEDNDTVLVGQYHNVGNNRINQPQSFLYVWREGKDRAYIELAPDTYNGNGVQTVNFSNFVQRSDNNFIAVADNTQKVILYDSSTNILTSSNGIGLIYDVTTDLNDNIVVIGNDQLYSWTNDDFELMNLGLDDGTTGVYSLTTLSDGRIFILAFGDTYQYVLTWDGQTLSKPWRFNKNYYLPPGSTAPQILLNYSDKPYVVIEYNEPIDGGLDGRIRFRAWDNGIWHPAITFGRVMVGSFGYSTDRQADGRFGLITTGRNGKNLHHIWDNEEHRWVTSYKAGTDYDDPRQFTDG
ncbi:MAG: hypothetical protein ACD_41C00353G0001, partial [uncultured bacterium]